MRRAVSVVIAIVVVCGVVLASALSGLITLPQLDLASFLSGNRTTVAEPEERLRTPESVVSKAAPSANAGEVASAIGAGQQADNKRPPTAAAAAVKIEVARIDPDGATVLAGRAPARSKVTLQTGGETLATATASEDGQWSAVVTKRFSPGQLDISITAEAPSGAAIKGPVLTVVVPKGTVLADLPVAPAGPRPVLPPKAPLAESRAINELAALVERARESGGQNQESIIRASSAVPVPITFVTGEATMTLQGMRAADLLVEYVRIMAPKTMTLSGHADMRGGDDYNLELSRQRLEAIEQYLRKHGYAGRLSLLPKGKSEPFAGIDRTSTAHEAVLQADRRVELRLVE